MVWLIDKLINNFFFFGVDVKWKGILVGNLSCINFKVLGFGVS